MKDIIPRKHKTEIENHDCPHNNNAVRKEGDTHVVIICSLKIQRLLKLGRQAVMIEGKVLIVQFQYLNTRITRFFFLLFL